MDDFVWCLYDGIEEQCDSHAANWIKTLKSLTLLPTRKEINCRDPQWKPVTIFGVILGGVVALTVTVILCLLYTKRQAHKHGLNKYVSVALKKEVTHENSLETENVQIQHSEITTDHFLGPSNAIQPEAV